MQVLDDGGYTKCVHKLMKRVDALEKNLATQKKEHDYAMAAQNIKKCLVIPLAAGEAHWSSGRWHLGRG